MHHPTTMTITTIEGLYNALSRRIAHNNTTAPRLALPRREPAGALERAQIVAIDSLGAKYNVFLDDSEAAQ